MRILLLLCSVVCHIIIPASSFVVPHQYSAVMASLPPSSATPTGETDATTTTSSDISNNNTTTATTTTVPRINNVTAVGSTKWLALQTLDWTDQDGVDRKWDMATRTTKSDAASADAVVIIPLLRSTTTANSTSGSVVETLLVEQYRPPLGQTTTEFPAGLMDPGETVEQAALRELREETGFVGEACKIPPISSRPVCMSPGLCNETVHVVLVEVDLDNPYNHGTPKPQLDDGEHCVVRRIGLQDGLKQLLDQGTAMPIMGLYLFAVGWELGAEAAAKK